jgi:hypothetical protein
MIVLVIEVCIDAKDIQEPQCKLKSIEPWHPIKRLQSASAHGIF